MKEREIYAGLRVLPPFLMRVDGRAFHQLCSTCSFRRPYDERFSDAMIEATRAIMAQSGLVPLFGYTFSDEISLYFHEDSFNGRIEKIDSVVASFISSFFTMKLELKIPISFDSRIIPMTDDLLSEYLIWRQNEAWRNHINGMAQHVLLKTGLSGTKVARKLDGIKASGLHEICHENGINPVDSPAWQRRGIIVRRLCYEKEGFNPITKTATIAKRRKVIIDKDIPLFGSPEGKKYIADLLDL